MSAFGTNWLDLSGTSNRYIQAYVKGFVDVSGGNVILRNNNFYVKNGDVSMAGRLFVSGDISSNANIYVANQIIAQPRLFTTVDFSSNLSNVSRLNILNNTYITGDASFNSRLFTTGDVSMAGRLFVKSDISLNGRLFANFPANSIPLNAIVGGVTAGSDSGGQIKGDVSANQRLFVLGDASLNSNLYVQGSIFSNAGTMLAQDASGQGSYLINADLPLDFSNNLATKWSSLTSTLGSYYWGTSMISANGQYQVVGDNSSGNVYISNNYGTSWTKAPVNLPYSAPNIPRSGPNAYPPVNFPWPTNSYTASGLRYGNGTYTITASEDRKGTGYCSGAFTTPDVYNFWQVTYTTNGSTYTANPQGTTTTVSGTRYAGAWVQIQMPSSRLSYIDPSN